MPTFITVHGTGDGQRENDDGEPQWWSPDSPFCSELIAAAEPTSRIEPFLWGGSNDEGERRQAAERLFVRVRRAQKEGERLHLIGHSHGGSVIATALRYAASERHQLPAVLAITSIGTPFLRLKHKFLWERFGAVGQAALTFATISALLAALGVFDLVHTAIDPSAQAITFFFADIFLWGGLTALAVCLTILMFVSRARRGLHSRSAQDRFSRAFSSRWLAIASRSDEAIGGLTRLNAIRAQLFSPSVLSPLVGSMAQLAYFAFIAAWWAIPFVASDSYDDAWATGTPYANMSFFQGSNVMLHHMLGPVLQPFVWLHAQWIEATRHLFFDAVLTGGDYSYGASLGLVFTVLFGVSIVVGYFVGLIALLGAVRWLSEHTIGAVAASLLNKSARNAAVSAGFGAGKVRENPAGVGAAPFGEGAEVERLPPEIDEEVLRFAEQNIGIAYRGMHKALFEVEVDQEEFTLSEAALRHLTWSELVHTAYFRVPECRRYLISRIVGRLGGPA
jgi:hypothetical protein